MFFKPYTLVATRQYPAIRGVDDFLESIRAGFLWITSQPYEILTPFYPLNCCGIHIFHTDNNAFAFCCLITKDRLYRVEFDFGNVS